MRNPVAQWVVGYVVLTVLGISAPAKADPKPGDVAQGGMPGAPMPGMAPQQPMTEEQMAQQRLQMLMQQAQSLMPGQNRG